MWNQPRSTRSGPNWLLISIIASLCFTIVLSSFGYWGFLFVFPIPWLSKLLGGKSDGRRRAEQQDVIEPDVSDWPSRW